jgi:ubiquinone/menaquinone biosynthesis C-methylase UbiE/DNA-binding transcriptional ArsR family regulator
MDELLVGLRAVAESTRVRILFVLSHGEFNVSELTQILGQSQPRVSRHLKLMVEAGMVSRHKEGNWVLFRLREEGLGGALSRAIVDMLPAHDAALTRDLARLEEIRSLRSELAASYFSSNAANWEKLRSLHIREEDVENAMQGILGNMRVRTLVDLGTGTGRALEIFAPLADQAIGIDSSREMIAIARANLEKNALRHAQVRQGDLYALPFANGSTDLVIIHQVLHYLEDPARALIEARRILHANGRLLIVDFAPHDLEVLRSEHAHRRLGISTEQLTTWFNRAGLSLQQHELLPPPWLKESTGLTVSLWLGVNKPQRATPQQSAALPEFNPGTS